VHHMKEEVSYVLFSKFIKNSKAIGLKDEGRL
jgi:hypothetical protein